MTNAKDINKEKLIQWINMAITESDRGLRMVLVENYRHPIFQLEEALARREAFELDNPGEPFGDTALFRNGLEDWKLINQGVQ